MDNRIIFSVLSYTLPLVDGGGFGEDGRRVEND
jgi:hypothetical protein